MKEHDIFISYKSDDFEVASWLRSVLETNGISCWMAPADIPGGSNYAREIPNAIEQCKVLVVVISSRTQESIWVPKELDTAINKGKTIMPFMVDNISLKDDFNFYLSNVQRYSAYESKTSAVEKMISEIRAILDKDTETLILDIISYYRNGAKGDPVVPVALLEADPYNREIMELFEQIAG